jgi:hypothetical protein
VLDALGENLPAEHAWHVVLEDAPQAKEKKPAGHAEQKVDAFSDENEPGGQSWHVELETAARSNEYMPAGHSSQVVAASLGL